MSTQYYVVFFSWWQSYLGYVSRVTCDTRGERVIKTMTAHTTLSFSSDARVWIIFCPDFLYFNPLSYQQLAIQPSLGSAIPRCICLPHIFCVIPNRLSKNQFTGKCFLASTKFVMMSDSKHIIFGIKIAYMYICNLCNFLLVIEFSGTIQKF